MIPETCSVALPLPAAQPYRYRVPRGLADRVIPGTRVVVPVRTRALVGVVTALDEDNGDGLKPVLLVPDTEAIIPPALLELAHWVSQYYATPIGITLRAILPAALWGSSRLVAEVRAPETAPGGASRDVLEALERLGGRASAARLARLLKRPVWDALQRLARAGTVSLETEPPDLGPAAGTERVIVLTRSLPSLLARDQAFGRARQQRVAYDALDALGGEATWRHCVHRLGFSPAVLRGLVARGLASIEKRTRLRDPFSGVASQPPGTPTSAQQQAIARLTELPPGGAGLLFGVTGSGKTAAYLEAIREEVAAGRGAIVLVPEIALTPQTIARVRGVFGDDVAVLHSALSDAERADAWRAVLDGTRRVVVGARSAVFAPVRHLAAIVVDEEHDASYKHGQAPRYHARAVAMARARIQGARVILASATPSLETWAARERIVVVRLPDRVADLPLPAVRLVDLRTAERVRESGPVPWSRDLDQAVEARLAAGQQVFLLLNRRGFAHYLQCTACGAVTECPNCSIALTVHQTPAGLRCHYCGHCEAIPPVCGLCGHPTQQTRGVGTQHLERWLETRYPQARLVRMDADTTARKWSHQRILDSVHRGEVDILFGTQMIAKGLDFPGVTLVGVVDADTGLHLPDFRAAERTFQLVAQVAGRAGRGPRGGEVIVQTRSPQHVALTAAAAHDFETFAEHELEQRRSPPYPPHVGLANIVVSGTDQDVVAGAAVDVADWLRSLLERRSAGEVDLIGPAPAPIARIKRRWRWHLLLRATNRSLLGRVIRYAARQAPHTKHGAAVRVVVDRDPVSLL